MTTDAVEAPQRLSPAELRELFLFTDLTDDQLQWVQDNGEVVTATAGANIVEEGAPAACFYVLLSGTVAMYRLIGGEEVETIRTDQRGVYFGGTQFLLEEEMDRTYPATTVSVTATVLLALPVEEFATTFRRWFPMAAHLLQGVVLGFRRGSEMLGQRERLLALGKLSAGLTHELNNPASAASRAADALRDRVAGMRKKLAMIAEGDLDRDKLRKLTMSQEEFVLKARNAPKLSAMQASDLEDELADWLDQHGVSGGWELAPIFVAGGLRVPDLEAVCEGSSGEVLEGALRWVAYTVETESLLREITDSTARISALVDAAKQYSQMDRAPHQWIDVHDGLDATLVMLSKKVGSDVEVVKDYDRSLPTIPAYPAELNQVWTNLIDNALDAMSDGGKPSGTLSLRTALEDPCVLIEISDTGPGIAPENVKRIFEPFFSTKPVGKGTGLGLDVSWRVVVNRHHGDLRVVSEPGDTRFEVRLPLSEGPA
jgi:signal transduction histidine kinase